MSDGLEWPEELDALNAAPQNHKLLLENEFVRVLDTCVQPGETVPLHTHKWHSALYVLSSSDFLRRDQQGKILVDSRNLGSICRECALWSDPLPPHTLENIGGAVLRAISVELKVEH